MEPSTPSFLAFDDVVLDLAGHRLSRGGAEQPLEPKAFGVLALLAQAPGRVFTRDEILDAVWRHRHVTPGVLNRVMTLLRHALGEDAHGARYLHTVHGVGYRFDLPVAETRTASEATQARPPESETAPMSALVEVRAPSASDIPRSPSRARGLLLLLAVLAVLAVVGWNWWPRLPHAPVAAATAAPATQRSIAVLPLVNASHDADQQFFSDGLSDSLIDTLSRFDGLKVIGRISSFRFRDGKDDSAAIGAKLGAAYLLSGSVQRAGDVVRINTTLTRAADGSTLWAEHYDRPYKDLFALQDEITQAVAGALHARLLSPNEAAKHSDRPPNGNIEAYNAYLRGLKAWHQPDFPEAAEHLTKAVRLDPGYAVAWADLSGSWSTTATFLDKDPVVAREHMRLARLAADKALQLAPGLGAAHAARAYLQQDRFDYQGALAECRRAVQLGPNNSMVLTGCGFVLTGFGKLHEALRLRERLLSIEPLYAVNTYEYARLLLATGRLDEAEKYLRIAEGLSSSDSPPSAQSMNAALARGDVTTALAVARRQPSPWREMYLAIATQISPDRTAADAALAKVLANEAWANTRPYPYLIAQAYALRDDPDRAMQWLQRAPAPDLLFLLADPLLLRLRNDPRFIAFCKQAGLPPPSESEALSIDQIRALPATKR